MSENCKMEKQILRGTVVFLLSDIGTKSEGIKPFLYLGRNALQLLLYEVPGERRYGEALAPFDGRFVEVVGKQMEDIFVVEELHLAEPSADKEPSAERTNEYPEKQK